MNLSHVLDSSTLKTGAISLLMGVLGYAGHAVIELNTDKVTTQTTLDSHTLAIQQLRQGQDETHHTLQELNTSVVRVEGKVDVVNQKIDDDRLAHK